jgi:hypothetical protein
MKQRECTEGPEELQNFKRGIIALFKGESDIMA